MDACEGWVDEDMKRLGGKRWARGPEEWRSERAEEEKLHRPDQMKLDQYEIPSTFRNCWSGCRIVRGARVEVKAWAMAASARLRVHSEE